MRHSGKLVVLMVALALLSGMGLSAQNVPIATGEWAPWVGEKLPGQGLSTEVIVAACKQAGLTPVFSWYGDAWTRCEADIAKGSAWATYPYTVTPERSKTYDFSDVLVSGRGLIYYVDGKGKDIAWNRLADFGSATFIGIAGYDYGETMAKENIKTVAALNTDSAFMMLKAGRGDYFISDEYVASASIKTVFGSESSKLKTVTKPWKEAQYRLMVSKTYPGAQDILKKFNAGLAAIKANGTLKAILAKYGMSM